MVSLSWSNASITREFLCLSATHRTVAILRHTGEADRIRIKRSVNAPQRSAKRDVTATPKMLSCSTQSLYLLKFDASRKVSVSAPEEAPGLRNYGLGMLASTLLKCGRRSNLAVTSTNLLPPHVKLQYARGDYLLKPGTHR